MSEYISDPELLKQLNTNEYVADPELLAKLNSPSTAPAMPNPGDYASIQAGMSSARPAAQAAYGLTGNARDLYSVGKNVLSASAEGIKEMVSHPIQTAKAYVRGHPYIVPGAAGLARGAASAIAAPLTAPENLFTLPYTMAAYAQDQIRANPNRPEYKYTPYAQAYRGEFPTQGAAAASNRRQAISNAPSGYTPNPEEASNLLLSNDERLINIYGGRNRLNDIIAGGVKAKAAQKVFGPVAPGNFK